MTERPSSIRALLTVLVLAVATPLIGATVYFGYRAQASERQRAEQELLDLGQAAATGITQFLTYSERLLAGLASDPHVRSLDGRSCAVDFPDVQHQLNPVFLSLDVWSSDGSVVCSTLASQGPSLNLLGTGSFDDAIRADTFRVSPVFRERRTGHWSTALTYPILAEDGSMGMLSAVVDLVRFQEILMAIPLPPDALVTVTENDGTVVARSQDSESWIGRETPPPDEVESGDPRTTATGLTRATTLEGVDYSWRFVRVARTPWVVYVGLPTAALLAPVWRQRIRLGLIGVIVIIAATVAAGSVHRKITRPLESLVEGIADSSAGSPRLPTDGPREVAVVAGRFKEAWAEVHRLQEHAAEVKKMEALGRLAGGIAHDFNNLLTVVQGHADLLQIDPSLPESHRQQVSEIMDAAERGAALNRQLLAFGRGTPGDPVPLDPNQVVEGMEMILRRALGEGVKLALNLGAASVVVADRSQLEQVVLNLIVNARDAMPRGGSVLIRTFEHEVTVVEARERPDAQAGPHVVLEVRDTGSGIADDVLPYVFEPFFSTKEETKGTGLGLATVYGVVTSARGHVRVHTKAGVGTTFQVLLPRHEGVISAQERPRSAAGPSRAAGDVLLVEDDGGVRRLTERVLGGAGYTVTSAEDGAEALRVAGARGTPYDVLVSDVVMPGMSGVQMARVLAESGSIRRAVFVSGYPEGLPAGGPGGVARWTFLPKPYSSEQLLTAVAHILRA